MVQVLSINNTTPVMTQKFEGAKFFRIPQEAQEILRKDCAFSRLSKDYDIFVSASAKSTWKDPFGFRVPKLDEKCRLTCEMQSLEDASETRIIRTYTADRFIAPLREHLQTLLKQVSDIDFEERLNRLIMP